MNNNDIDLLISNDDIVLDAFGQPLLVTGRACIVQDIKHLLRDRGFLVAIIAERDKNKRRAVQTQIERAVEDDERIKPGSVRVTEGDAGVFLLEATSMAYGPVALEFLEA
jgi:hypothetical protein